MLNLHRTPAILDCWPLSSRNSPLSKWSFQLCLSSFLFFDCPCDVPKSLSLGSHYVYHSLHDLLCFHDGHFLLFTGHKGEALGIQTAFRRGPRCQACQLSPGAPAFTRVWHSEALSGWGLRAD